MASLVAKRTIAPSASMPLIFFITSRSSTRTSSSPDTSLIPFQSRALARSLSRPIYAIDLRNHGDTSHDKVHNYTALAEDVENFLRKHEIKDATLIGHSMGAKTVMTVALRDPNACANIIAVDNAPVDAALASDFPRYVEGMRKVEDGKVKSQKEADEILEPYAKV